MVIDRATISVGKTLEGDARTYTCNAGTVQESGPNKIVCQNNGLWSSTDIYCRRTLFIEHAIGFKFFFEIKSMFHTEFSLSSILMQLSQWD